MTGMGGALIPLVLAAVAAAAARIAAICAAGSLPAGSMVLEAVAAEGAAPFTGGEAEMGIGAPVRRGASAAREFCLKRTFVKWSGSASSSSGTDSGSFCDILLEDVLSYSFLS